jgi:Outer membrane protein beta-barrel domain
LKLRIYKAVLAVATVISAIGSAEAQSIPTATQALQLSVFGGATGTFTGLNSGRNLGITAGVDLTRLPIYGFSPSLEVRGTYPVDGGQVDSQRNVLGGLKVEKPYDRFRPYGDVLFGRGSTPYENGGFPDPSHTFLYIENPANVLSLGVGTDYNLSRRFAVKADIQFQRYASPVTVSGHLYSKPITFGIVYHFEFNHGAP